MKFTEMMRTEEVVEQIYITVEGTNYFIKVVNGLVRGIWLVDENGEEKRLQTISIKKVFGIDKQEFMELARTYYNSYEEELEFEIDFRSEIIEAIEEQKAAEEKRNIAWPEEQEIKQEITDKLNEFINSEDGSIPLWVFEKYEGNKVIYTHDDKNMDVFYKKEIGFDIKDIHFIINWFINHKISIKNLNVCYEMNLPF